MKKTQVETKRSTCKAIQKFVSVLRKIGLNFKRQIKLSGVQNNPICLDTETNFWFVLQVEVLSQLAFYFSKLGAEFKTKQLFLQFEIVCVAS